MLDRAVALTVAGLVELVELVELRFERAAAVGKRFAAVAVVDRCFARLALGL